MFAHFICGVFFQYVVSKPPTSEPSKLKNPFGVSRPRPLAGTDRPLTDFSLPEPSVHVTSMSSPWKLITGGDGVEIDAGGTGMLSRAAIAICTMRVIESWRDACAIVSRQNSICVCHSTVSVLDVSVCVRQSYRRFVVPSGE